MSQLSHDSQASSSIRNTKSITAIQSTSQAIMYTAAGHDCYELDDGNFIAGSLIVSTKLIAKRWTTEITERDRLFLEKLGVPSF